jgi:hypothetical protein
VLSLIPAFAAEADFIVENGTLTKYTGIDAYVKIPAGVTAIGAGVFSGNSFIESLSVPGSVKTIGGSAFKDCERLKKVTIDYGFLTTIGASAFENCKRLTDINIPDTTRTIEVSAFQGTRSLKTITFPKGLVTIGNSAFQESALELVTIPETVTSVGLNAFSGDIYLTAITAAAENTAYTTYDGVLYSKWATRLVQYPAGRAGPYVIPNGVTTISDGAFWGSVALTSITIPNSVTEIGSSAFWDCKLITAITLPDSVTKLGGRAFGNSPALYSVSIPGSVQDIEYETFLNCKSLTNVILAEGVKTIGTAAFKGCTALSVITVPSSVIFFDSQVFDAATLKKINGIKGSATESYAALTRLTFADANLAPDWAAVALQQINASGLIPPQLQSLYTAYATRAEFAALVVPLLERKLGTIDITGITASDTTDANILKCKAVGVMSGNGAFMNPNGIMTRSTAAGFIANTARALGFEDKTADLSIFSDSANIADWAKPGVEFVVGWKLMVGDGQTFNPNTIYMRISCIIAFKGLSDLYTSTLQ